MAVLTKDQLSQVFTLTLPYATSEPANSPMRASKSMVPTHLPTSVFESLQARPSSSGNLASLPLELQRQIILACDFTTIAAMRLVNYHCYAVVAGLKEYVALTAHPLDEHWPHASATLKLMGEAKVLKYHALADMYAAFTQSKCVFCGELAPYLLLVTCERTCFQCLKGNSKTRMVDGAMAKRVWALDSWTLDECVKEGWLRYAFLGCSQIGAVAARRLYLVSEVAALALKIYESEEAIATTVKLQEDELAKDHHERADQGNSWRGEHSRFERFYNPEWPAVPSLPSSVPSLDENGRGRLNPVDRYRCMGAVTMPVLNPDQSIEGMVWCFGCTEDYLKTRWESLSVTSEELLELKKLVEIAMHKAWTVEGFLKIHFEQCSTVRKVWNYQGSDPGLIMGN